VGVLARIREDVTCLKQRGSVLDPGREGLGRLGRPGLAWRVELAVRNADRALLALTLMVTVVAPMWVAFQVRVESRYPIRRVLAVVVPIRVRSKVLMEMSQRGEDGEKDERCDLETRNHEVKKWATHGVTFSSVLRPKSTVLASEFGWDGCSLAVLVRHTAPPHLVTAGLVMAAPASVWAVLTGFGCATRTAYPLDCC